MVATSGDRLLAPDAIEALRTKLIPRAALITPNLPEAAALLDEPIASSESQIESQGKRLLAMGAGAVLIKGGHGQGRREHRLSHPRSRRCCVGGATHRHQKYPRHRMLAVLGHRGGPCQRRRSGDRGSQRQGLDDCGDCRGRSPERRSRPWADPSFPRVRLRTASTDVILRVALLRRCLRRTVRLVVATSQSAAIRILARSMCDL